VTSKKPRTGGEIDAWCTKCKLDLTHRIIAMVGDAVKKVECKTCGSHHLYRAPKSERDRKAAARAVARGDGAPKPAGPPSRSGERLTAAQRAEREQTAAWEHAIAGKPSGAFKAYRITLILSEGELVHHSKFGDGVVARVIDPGKVEILFKDGPKTMAHGQQIAG
jgi:Zn ribbon nucleic-acid-binding protein